jgi:hypothetical protein
LRNKSNNFQIEPYVGGARALFKCMTSRVQYNIFFCVGFSVSLAQYSVISERSCNVLCLVRELTHTHVVDGVRLDWQERCGDIFSITVMGRIFSCSLSFCTFDENKKWARKIARNSKKFIAASQCLPKAYPRLFYCWCRVKILSQFKPVHATLGKGRKFI